MDMRSSTDKVNVVRNDDDAIATNTAAAPAEQTNDTQHHPPRVVAQWPFLSRLRLPSTINVLFDPHLTMVDAVVRTLQILAHQPKLFILLSLVAWLPFVAGAIIFSILVNASVQRYPQPIWLTVLVAVLVLVGFPASTCAAQVGAIQATAEIYAGKVIDTRRFVRELLVIHNNNVAALRRMAIYWGLVLGGGIVIGIPSLFGAILFVSRGMQWPKEEEEPPLVLLVPYLMVFCTALVTALVCSVLVNPILVLESKTIPDATVRAWQMLRYPQAGWNVAALLLVFVAIWIVVGVCTGPVVPFFMPCLANIQFTVIYLHLRVKHERLDRSTLWDELVAHSGATALMEIVDDETQRSEQHNDEIPALE